MLQLAGCRCEPMSAVVEMRRNVFEVLAADRGTLNPLHAGKSVYRYTSPSCGPNAHRTPCATLHTELCLWSCTHVPRVSGVQLGRQQRS